MHRFNIERISCSLAKSKTPWFPITVGQVHGQSLIGALLKSYSNKFQKLQNIIFFGVLFYQVVSQELVISQENSPAQTFSCEIYEISQERFLWKTVNGCLWKFRGAMENWYSKNNQSFSRIRVRFYFIILAQKHYGKGVVIPWICIINCF